MRGLSDGGSGRLWPDPLIGLPRVGRLKKVVHLLAALFVIVTVIFGLASQPAPDAWAIASVAALALVAGLLMAGASEWVRSSVLAVALGCAVLSSTAGPPPAFVIAAIMFNLVVARATRSLVVLLPGICIGYAFLMWWSGRGVASAIDDALLAAGPALGASVFLTTIVRHVERADRLHEVRVRTELAGSFDSAVRAAAESLNHFLHDRVLAALSAIANHSEAERQRLIQFCGQVANDIQGAPGRAEQDDPTLRSVIGGVCREVDLDVQVHFAPRGADSPLPSDTAAALRRAVGEALRNCARHAGVDAATIRHEDAGSVSSLVVGDSGRGFGEQPMGWGIVNSITQPMSRIGGGAHVHGEPGSGTIVTLTWPSRPAKAEPSRLLRTYEETSKAVGAVPVLSLIVAPLLLANAYVAVRYSIGDTTAVPELALAVGATIATFMLLRAFLHGGPRLWSVLAIAVTSSVTVIAGLLLAEPADALTSYDSWCIGLAAVGPFVMALYLPPAFWSILLPNPVIVVLAAQLEPTVGILQALGALNAALLPAYALACGAAIRAMERRLARDVARLAEATRELGRSQRARGPLAQERFLALRVAPWLRKLASGEVSIGDAEASAKARLLAHEARDALNLPGVLDDPLRDRITAARSQGTTVVLVPGDADGEERQLALRLLDRALDEPTSLSSIVLYLEGQGTTKLTANPELSPHRLRHLLACLDHVPHSVENDGLTTTIAFGQTTEIA